MRKCGVDFKGGGGHRLSNVSTTILVCDKRHVKSTLSAPRHPSKHTNTRDKSTDAHLRCRPSLHRLLHYRIIISRYKKLSFCPSREFGSRMLAEQQLSTRDVAADAAEEAALMNYIVALIPMAYVHADSSGLELDCLGTCSNVLQHKRLGAKDVARKL